MASQSKYSKTAWFVGGLIAGPLVYHAILYLAGLTLVSQEHSAAREAEIAALQQENHELSDDLFRFSGPDVPGSNEDELPYQADDDASATVAAARQQAVAEQKFLMITFGANWCLDCRSLHRRLNSDVVAGYTRELFKFVNVDVGKFNRNREVAAALGVDLSRGIPVAVVFDPAGQLIGNTNNGELEPARHYSSMQILKFVRDIAERSRVAAPDAVF